MNTTCALLFALPTPDRRHGRKPLNNCMYIEQTTTLGREMHYMKF
jgi:hypothetical protein